ncbi:ribonuclease M5 [Weissella viridescens]|nr:ribonuclease M5 [Weissella viridescens]
MTKIQEVIVVEGKADTQVIQQAVDADTLETNGSALNPATLKAIQEAAERRGIIVFTDPDFNGERLRQLITDAVPTAKHAF